MDQLLQLVIAQLWERWTVAGYWMKDQRLSHPSVTGSTPVRETTFDLTRCLDQHLEPCTYSTPIGHEAMISSRFDWPWDFGPSLYSSANAKTYCLRVSSRRSRMDPYFDKILRRLERQSNHRPEKEHSLLRLENTHIICKRPFWFFAHEWNWWGKWVKLNKERTRKLF
jgi:hypothetical protein